MPKVILGNCVICKSLSTRLLDTHAPGIAINQLNKIISVPTNKGMNSTFRIEVYFNETQYPQCAANFPSVKIPVHIHICGMETVTTSIKPIEFNLSMLNKSVSN